MLLLEQASGILSDTADSFKRFEHELPRYILSQFPTDPQSKTHGTGDHGHHQLPQLCFIAEYAPMLRYPYTSTAKGCQGLAPPPVAPPTQLITLHTMLAQSMQPPPATTSRTTVPLAPVVTYRDNDMSAAWFVHQERPTSLSQCYFEMN
jgi:hypothetical protein